MKITKVVLRNKEKEDSRMKAIATVTLDEAFVITGIRLIQGDDKMFIAMPSRKVSEVVYDDIAHPVNQETRQMFEDAIFKAYDEMKNTESLLEATKIIDKFWEENLSKLDNNNFIVYGSTKAYSLDSSGFHAGGKRSFEDAKAIL